MQGLCGFSWSSLNAQRPDWVKSGFVRVIVQEHDKGNDPISGADLQDLAAKIFATPTAFVEKTKGALVYRAR